MVQGIVICRKGSDDLRPGFVRGYFCVICGIELQVSPSGVAMLKSGSSPLCNPDGFAVAEKLKDRSVLIQTPEAIQQIIEFITKARGN